MSPLKVGAGIAALVAGYPLYTLVQAGSLDGLGALERWAAVAIACGVGAHFVERLVADYQQDSTTETPSGQTDSPNGPGGSNASTGPQSSKDAPAGGPGATGTTGGAGN